jgi:hypothetical protein
MPPKVGMTDYYLVAGVRTGRIFLIYLEAGVHSGHILLPHIYQTVGVPTDKKIISPVFHGMLPAAA